jgi:hypothetical protein
MRSLRTMSRSKNVLLPIVVLGLVLGACGGDDDEESSETTTTEPGDATTTAADSASTTTATEGDDEWVEVARGLYTRYADLLANPDPDRVGELYAETCSCWDEFFGTVEFLASEGDHIEGQPTSVTFVQHEMTDPATGLVDLTVKGQANELHRVDSDGSVVEEYPAEDAPGCTSFSIKPDGPEGAYRIYSETPLTGCPEGV